MFEKKAMKSFDWDFNTVKARLFLRSTELTTSLFSSVRLCGSPPFYPVGVLFGMNPLAWSILDIIMFDRRKSTLSISNWKVCHYL
ncbi:hypothetical protein AQUCO_12300006v1 [Aquilegia coerulea]|uniref:Uncharacterized protein n=1 Tax=Aquilegia coerulea TaxID=218851 RepID=A0A2G5C1L1_AQUCA|nr:hypothetical protein AQUCO_12300006v1 [Aquilegia coerulea]